MVFSFSGLRRGVLAALGPCAFAAALSGPAVAADEKMSTLRGVAAYRERIAVRPDVRLEVRLLDVSRADAPAQTLAEVTIPDAGLPPYRFELPYAADRLQAGHRYSVQAKLLHGDRLLFTTDRQYPVEAGRDPGELKLLLIKAGRRAAGANPQPTPAPGSDRDAQGCIASAGYAWCARDAVCARPWELLDAKGLARDPKVFAAYCSAGKASNATK